MCHIFIIYVKLKKNFTQIINMHIYVFSTHFLNDTKKHMILYSIFINEFLSLFINEFLSFLFRKYVFSVMNID